MAKKKIGKLRKALIIIISCILAVVIILGAFLLIWFNADSYKDFEDFTKRFEIPALDDGVVPQGLANYGDKFFTSNYMVDGSASRVYYIDGGSEEKYVTFTYNGKEYTGHCGGIATDGNYFWMCSGTYIYTTTYDEIVSTASADGGVVELTARLDAGVNAAYLFYADGFLYVGEFYREQNYQTDESHHLTTPCGDANNAIALVYYVTDTEYGLTTTPLYGFSTTERVQGFAIINGVICLSQSYGLANSHILVYDNADVFDSDNSEIITLNERNITVYYLDSNSLANDYSIPSMSEGLCVYNNEVYILFESAGKKYRMYVRERLYNVYSFVPIIE